MLAEWFRCDSCHRLGTVHAVCVASLVGFIHTWLVGHDFKSMFNCAVSPFCVSCGLGRQSLPWQQRRWTWLAQAQQCAAA